MRYCLLPFLFLAALGGCSLLFEAEQPDARTAQRDAAPDAFKVAEQCEAGWLRRLPLDIDNTFFGNDTLSDFPILVRIESTMHTSLGLQVDGSDLRFSDNVGTPLDYEIDVWDPLATSFVWVKIPNVPKDATTQIWMYGGNADATDAQNASRVWSNGFRGVWHFSDHESLPDSSGHLDPGIAEGTVSASSDEQALGRAVVIGNSGRIVVSPDTSFQTPNAVTLEMRIMLTLKSPAASRGAFEIADSLVLAPKAAIPELRVFLSGDESSPTGELSDAPWDLLTWYYLVGTYDVSEKAGFLYVNGMRKDFVDSASIRLIQTNGNALVLGRDLRGTIDEARISSVARSAAWIAAEQRSLGNALVRPQSVSSCPE